MNRHTTRRFRARSRMTFLTHSPILCGVESVPPFLSRIPLQKTQCWACQFRDTRDVHKHFGIVELQPARIVRDVMFPLSISTQEQCIHWHVPSHSGAAEPRHDVGLLGTPMQETSLWCTCSEFAPPGRKVSPTMQRCVFQSKSSAKVLFRVADPFLITDDVKVVSMNQHVDLEFIVHFDKGARL